MGRGRIEPPSCWRWNCSCLMLALETQPLKLREDTGQRTHSQQQAETLTNANRFCSPCSRLSTHLISTRPHTMSESHPDFKAEEFSVKTGKLLSGKVLACFVLKILQTSWPSDKGKSWEDYIEIYICLDYSLSPSLSPPTLLPSLEKNKKQKNRKKRHSVCPVC